MVSTAGEHVHEKEAVSPGRDRHGGSPPSHAVGSGSETRGDIVANGRPSGLEGRASDEKASSGDVATVASAVRNMGISASQSGDVAHGIVSPSSSTAARSRSPEAKEKKSVRVSLPKSHSHTSLHRKGRQSVGLAKIVRAGLKGHVDPLAVAHAREREHDATPPVAPSRPKLQRQSSTSGSSTTTAGRKSGGDAVSNSSRSTSRKRTSSLERMPPPPKLSPRRDAGPEPRASLSRSPSSISGAQREFVPSPLAVVASVTPQSLRREAIELAKQDSNPTPAPVVAPAPGPGAAQGPSSGPKRPSMPGRAHTSAVIVRPPTTASSSRTATATAAQTAQKSKSPTRRPEASSSKAAGHSTKKKPVMDVSTESDFETTDDSSMWSSAEDDEEVEVPPQQQRRGQAPAPAHNGNGHGHANAPINSKGKGRANAPLGNEEVGNIAREAALEAARQRDMFRKIPSRSYSNLALRPQSGLLTPLLNPDPRLVPYLPTNGHPTATLDAIGRPHNSTHNLGRRTGPLAALQPMTAAGKSFVSYF